MTEATCANTAWTTVNGSASAVPTILTAIDGNILYNTTEAAASPTDGTPLSAGFQVVIPAGLKLFVIASGGGSVKFHHQAFGA